MVPNNDTRQRILDSAQDLIYSRSYADVGVAAICDAAKVKKGSFYHFFPSKQNLTLAVLDESLLFFKRQIIDKALAQDIPPMQRFHRFVDAAYLFQKQMVEQTGQTLGCPFGNLALELSTQDEPIRLKIESIFKHIESRFKSTLDEAKQLGEIGNVDTQATAIGILAYMEGVLLMAKNRNDPEIIKQLGPALTHIRL